MAHFYRTFIDDIRRIDEMISHIEQTIAELNWKITEIDKQSLVPQSRLACAEEMINRLEKSIGLASHHTPDGNQTHKDLHKKPVNNDKLSRVKTDRTVHQPYTICKKLSDFDEREQFIKQTAADIFKKEAKLRCIRAASKIVE